MLAVAGSTRLEGVLGAEHLEPDTNLSFETLIFYSVKLFCFEKLEQDLWQFTLPLLQSRWNIP